jgi:hypothetical protein
MIPIQERNRQILQMRKEGIPRPEVARRFGLSRERISQLEKRDEADKSMAEKRANFREAVRTADDPGRTWPVNDLVDAIGLSSWFVLGIACSGRKAYQQGTHEN